MYRLVIKSLKYIIPSVLLIALVIGCYFWLRPKKEEITVSRAEITDVKALAQLCAVDFYSEVPVVDTINNKVLVGIQKQRGSISFDMEALDIDASGDTVKVRLPKEIIDVHEATDPKSWEVIDSKYIGPIPFLHSDKLSVEEENILKRHIRTKTIRSLYADGTVRRVRKEAATNLASLLSRIYRKPVMVIL